MHHQATTKERDPLLPRLILCFLSYVLAVLGGLLGYYVHPLLYTALPIGASLCAGLVWRLSRV